MRNTQMDVEDGTDITVELDHFLIPCSQEKN